MLVVLSSCSVKEDRGRCPCRLVLVPDSTVCAPVMNVYLNSSAFSENLNLDAGSGQIELAVPRSVVHVTAVEQHGEITPEDRRVLYAHGFQADSLYCSTVLCDCNADECIALIGTSKQFATVYLNVLTDDNPVRMKSAVVEGNVNGFDMAAMAPIEGAFRCELLLDGFQSCSFRIPRQKDSSLIVRLIDAQGRETSFDAGNKICLSGYDWTQDDLPDILLDVDCAQVESGIVISDWSIKTVEW